jgi:hypothetical protein
LDARAGSVRSRICQGFRLRHLTFHAT